jgi:hypothetical protein
LIFAEGETIAEPGGEEAVQRVTEFFTAFINTTYLLEDRGVLHTDRSANTLADIYADKPSTSVIYPVTYVRTYVYC